jgi:hypothetical protein
MAKTRWRGAAGLAVETADLRLAGFAAVRFAAAGFAADVFAVVRLAGIDGSRVGERSERDWINVDFHTPSVGSIRA